MFASLNYLHLKLLAQVSIYKLTFHLDRINCLKLVLGHDFRYQDFSLNLRQILTNTVSFSTSKRNESIWFNNWILQPSLWHEIKGIIEVLCLILTQ